ncbi:hypothetical protein [Hyalangium gracile]|uniref:hypothetical protein n=1 Tax=Hyalangium gracile TaxID=394092 RepID=UPI001CCC8843|nr:hypothetical protein [Hyalangium gracile]
MFRIWLCLIALLVASIGGSGFVSAGAPGSICAQSCPDDDERGECAPDCTDCSCCSHVPPVVLSLSPSLEQDLPPSPSISHEEQEPPSLEVGEILHVPIVALA